MRKLYGVLLAIGLFALLLGLSGGAKSAKAEDGQVHDAGATVDRLNVRSGENIVLRGFVTNTTSVSQTYIFLFALQEDAMISGTFKHREYTSLGAEQGSVRQAGSEVQWGVRLRPGESASLWLSATAKVVTTTEEIPAVYMYRIEDPQGDRFAGTFPLTILPSDGVVIESPLSFITATKVICFTGQFPKAFAESGFYRFVRTGFNQNLTVDVPPIADAPNCVETTELPPGDYQMVAKTDHTTK